MKRYGVATRSVSISLMLVVDTNVVVRYVTNDDPVQSPVARRLVDGNQTRLTWTVVLETEWVLRSAHKLTRDRILFVMRQFLRMPTVHVDDPSRLAAVLEWFEQGMDFADALHLAGCNENEAFATFDRQLAATAKRAKAGKVKAL